MTLSSITESIRIALLVVSFLRNPEESLIKILDDFKNADSNDTSAIKEGICKKINCDNITIEPDDSSINLNFIGTEEPIDTFTLNITSFVLGIATKISPIVSIMLPDIEFEKTLKDISIIHNEIDSTTFIEIPRKDGSLKLHITSNPEEKVATIKIPIESEKVLEKLKEMKEN